MMELLAPAGSMESLKAAVSAGADAVYIGGSRFGARAYAENPQEDQLLRGIDYCHVHGKALYLTVNTLLKEQELQEELYDYLLPYYKEGLDGVIVQDFGVMRFIQKNFPLLPIHASTQMTITGVDGAAFLKEQGACRIVPARELSLEEVRQIIQSTGLEVETFVHGAMCYSYSGQCLFSSMLGGRSGNRGRCAQPCRLPYTLLQQGKPVVSEPRYLMSLKDMCAVDLLPELEEAGIASLKIEGRMKKPEYTAGVVSIYRKYLDRIQWGDHRVKVSEEDRRALLDLYSRGGFSEGYYHCAKGPQMMTMSRPNHLGSQAAQIEKRKKTDRMVRGKALCALAKGDVLEAISKVPGQKGCEYTVGQDVAAGKSFPLPGEFGKISAGTVLYRTRNQKLLDHVKDTWVIKECKEKIKGSLIIFPEKPVILKLYYGEETVTVTGAVAQKAQNRPLTEEEICRQMKKTGDSPFVFEDIQIQMEGAVFLPLQSLNQLRREGLAQLEENLCSRFVREEQGHTEAEKKEYFSRTPQNSGSFDYRLTVSVQELTQLETVLSWNLGQKQQYEKISCGLGTCVDTIYLDCALLFPATKQEKTVSGADMITSIQNAGIRCCIQMPPIFREKERAFYSQEKVRRILSMADGFLVRTVDAVAFLLAEGYGQDIIGEEGLYAYNREAAAFWKQAGVHRLTLPAELNESELGKLETDGCELVVYGRSPLMFTAQCLKMNTTGCTGIPDLLILKDRKNAAFPVRTRCRECGNVIYNSVPLDLLGCRTSVDRLHPSHLRLSFTTETAKETADVLARYGDLAAGKTVPVGTDSTTRGHFRRGVE